MSREESSRQAISDAYVALVVSVGLPASCGRIFAALLLSREPLTQAQLRAELSLSEGSVSEGLRLLARHEYVERANDQRTRPALFQVSGSAWSQPFRNALANVRAGYALSEMVLRHLDEVGIDGPAFELMSRGRAGYEVFVEELPAVVDRAIVAGERAPARQSHREVG